MFLARKQLLTLKEERRRIEAATRLQTAWRRYVQCKTFLSLKTAAVQLQRRWRARQAGRTQRTAYLTQQAAALTLQAAWRGSRCRVLFKLERSRVIICQAVVRMFLARRRFLRTVAAARTLQCYTRAWIEGRAERHRFLCLKHAAVRVQAWWRMTAQRQHYTKMVTSATLIQSWTRMRTDRNKFLKRKAAAVNIQRWYRSLQKGREQRVQYLALRRAAERIQRQWRLRQFRQAVARELALVRLCQAAVRGFLERRRIKRRKEEVRREKAAILIQAAVRGALQRRKFVAMRNAAVRLQRWIRWSLESIRLAQEYAEKKGGYSWYPLHIY